MFPHKQWSKYRDYTSVCVTQGWSPRRFETPGVYPEGVKSAACVQKTLLSLDDRYTSKSQIFRRREDTDKRSGGRSWYNIHTYGVKGSLDSLGRTNHTCLGVHDLPLPEIEHVTKGNWSQGPFSGPRNTCLRNLTGLSPIYLQDEMDVFSHYTN